MSSSTGGSAGRRQWRWWVPVYPERLGLRDVVQIASTILLTVLFAAAALGSRGSGGRRWLLALAAALGAFALVGMGWICGVHAGPNPDGPEVSPDGLAPGRRRAVSSGRWSAIFLVRVRRAPNGRP